MLRNFIFKNVKKIIPKISETELIALKSGTTCIDRNIFEGKVNYPKPFIYEKKINDEKVNSLLCKYGNEQCIYPNDKTYEIFNYIGKEKFLSFIINEKYDGYNLSTSELSAILTKISSQNPALGVAIMVPNSLGPGELLQHYGTNKQKEYFLPKLSNGDFIPCFGLTGPNNGSDATGSIDEGEVILNEHGEKVINIIINKRYITLAPVANLVGVAFNLKDTYDLLDKGKPGVTLALLESNKYGLKQDTHHNPLNAGFPNGTLKGSLQIPLENIIGGEENAGNGWKMLMECLAAGRGICLPATANAASKVSTFGVFHYGMNRKQFNIPLLKMEGVQNKFADMLYNTWLIQSSISLTNNILDNGDKPAVISAIMKQQTTDRARDVINHGMDIHAGSAICLGENNFMEKFFKSSPIGITVEGSNTITRNLIIFGQGLNKSHPYIYPILENILNDDAEGFKQNFKNIVEHSLSMYGKSWAYNSDILEKQTIQFANLANFIALKGGAIKKEQSLSADMADLLSNLYLGYGVKWYHENNNVSEKLTKYCINRLAAENQIILNRIIDNSGTLKPFLFHMKKKVRSENYDDNRDIINEVINNREIMNEIKKDIYTKDTVLEKLERLTNLDNKSDEYKEIYNDVIQVAEYPNK